MPIIKSAKKKLKQDRKKSKQNARYTHTLQEIMKKFKKKDKKITLNTAYAAIDRTAKKRIIHPHKAARLKSQIARLHKKNT